jgi:hypothetical protein
MSERTFHVDLSSSEFPYNFRELSSTVVFNQGSEIQRGVPGGLGGTEAVKNFGLPQAYYLDNVLPITRGYSTVGFSSVVPSAEITGDIVASFNILGKSDNIALFVATRTSVHVYDPNGGQWRQFSIGAAEADRISYAYIKEVTYIYYGYNVYIYNFDSQDLELQELKGIDAAALQGITAAGAYLIAWDATTIYRSSVLDPLDFDPTNGLSTGAGSTGVLAVKGRILTCLTLGQDFVIYTKNNAISARQTGQIQFPFIFDEIPGSAGILSVAHVAYNSNQGTHVTWTASGFQEVTLGGAQYIWPELSDGITRGITVNTDVVFGIPDFQRVLGLQVSLSFASNRWIVVSTGAESSVRSEAYVYDTVLGRWGRLKVPHVAFFEFLIPEVFFAYTYEQFGIDYPFYSSIPESMVYAQLTSDNQITVQGVGNNLGMLLPDGSVYTVSWSETGEFRGQSEVIGAAKSRIILGKFKPFRTRGMIHQSLKVTRLFDASLKLYGHDYTGKFIAVKDDLVQNQKHKGQWFGRLNADSVSIGIEGKFLLTDLSFVATDSGKINQRYTELSTVLVATTEIYPLEEPTPPVDDNLLLALNWERDSGAVTILPDGTFYYEFELFDFQGITRTTSSLVDSPFRPGVVVTAEFTLLQNLDPDGSNFRLILFWEDEFEGFSNVYNMGENYPQPVLGELTSWSIEIPDDGPVTETGYLMLIFDTGDSQRTEAICHLTAFKVETP